ncbi:hypothetical protein [Flavobacterium sp.]
MKIEKDNSIENKIKLSDKYKGVFSKTDAIEFDKYTQTMRKEWDNN